jgi:LysM repeat protein
MQKTFLTFFYFIVFTKMTIAQQDDFVLHAGSKGLYIVHKVVPKENFYSIGRLFNVHPKHIAGFNNLDMSKGLNIGQLINIPLTDTNFSHSAETGTAIYYKTVAGDDLYKLSSRYNIPAGNIRKWNHLPSDKLSAGLRLVIGRLVHPGEQQATVSDPKIQEEKNITTASTNTADKNQSQAEEKTTSAAANEKIETKDALPAQPETAKKEEPVKPQQQPVQQPVQQTTLEGTGYFKAYFAQQIKTIPQTKEETVTAGIFKTTSGWNDGKYYALIDNVQPGTIIKISNPTNGKIVYAKVLGEMSGIRQNQGLTIRISNAAAAALSITEEDKFIVQINY